MTPPDSQGEPTEEEWDKVGDVLEIIEKCMNGGSSHMGGCNPENHLQEALAQARADGRAEAVKAFQEDSRDQVVERALLYRIAEREAEFQEMLLAEHRLSDAYLRIRQIVDAFDTPKSPTAEEVWAHTESKVLAERTRREEAENTLESLREALLQEIPLTPYGFYIAAQLLLLPQPPLSPADIEWAKANIEANRAKRKGEKG